MNGTPHLTLVRVRYSETDQMRFVYYAHHFVYYEVARTEWLAAKVLPYDQMEAQGFAIPVLEAHCQYLSPARYGDLLAVELSARSLDGLRIRFDYRTFRGSPQGELLATGWTVHVCMDALGKPRRPPPEVRAVLADSSRNAGDPLAVAPTGPEGMQGMRAAEHRGKERP
ncbi:MAG TPA: thioesterase family protein [Fibrobacteria bacterium]|nr:thioesterase family protein [Fibrobacteria bacterium]HOX50147.1 thioesterase family protein [Fibrobacteria bacterium]